MHDVETGRDKATRIRGGSIGGAAPRHEVTSIHPADPAALDTASILRLQRIAGNAGVVQLLAQGEGSSTQTQPAVAGSSATAQREDEPGVDGAAIAQRQMEPEEEEEETSAE